MTVEQLIEKWVDILDCAETWEERNLAQEAIDDFRDIARG